MLSPYSLSRPGGVQGQVFGLARALRKLGHDVTVLGPDDDGGGRRRGASVDRQPRQWTSYVVGRPPGFVPMVRWRQSASRPCRPSNAERYVRKNGFDVLHLHEPLAPMAPYGFVLSTPVPMVGTYHRAGVSRWVHVFKPLAQLVGDRTASAGGRIRSGGRHRSTLERRRIRSPVQWRRHGAVRLGRARSDGSAHCAVLGAPRDRARA